jgi:muramoyltetrapeptide carboxypeptidase
MLTHLKLAGKFDRLAGLVFGDFTQCDGEGPRDIGTVIAEIFHDAPYPVVMGLPAGHGAENLAFPLGVRMSLDGDLRTLSLLESPVK